MGAYVEYPTSETEATLLGLVPSGDAGFYLEVCGALREAMGSAWGTQMFGPDWSKPQAQNRGAGRRLRTRRPVGVLASAGVAAALVALVTSLAAVLPGGTPTGVPRLAAAAAWRTAGMIDQPAWQPSGSGGTVGTAAVVTCPSMSDCFADTPGAGRGSTVVEVSTDGGFSWQASSLPDGEQLTSALSCFSATECFGGGLELGQGTGASSGAADVVITMNAGATWSTYLLPTSVARITNLACVSAVRCVGAGYGPSSDPGSLGPAVGVQLSTQGTLSATVTSLPAPFVAYSSGGLACAPGGGLCVLAGATSFATPASGTTAVTGAVLRSTDGGRTWSWADVPTALARVRAVSCPSGGRCIGIGNEAAPTSGSDPYGPSQALISSNGGQTWVLTGSYGLPKSTLTSIACPSATRCWASGHTLSTSSGVLTLTSDGGASWSATQVPTDSGPRQQQRSGLPGADIENVSSVSCPTTSTCMAMAAPVVLASEDRQIVLRSEG